MNNLMKKILTYLCVLTLIISTPVVATAHSGRTDAQGGHHDYNNVSGLGSYHYHHGCGPHLHEGGKCPYETTSSTKAKTSTKKKCNTTLKKAQQKLNKLGYSCGKADGVMGSKTRKAIRKFQKANKLKVTGTLTKGTKRKLRI